jgi:replicative DNA helicase
VDNNIPANFAYERHVLGHAVDSTEHLYEVLAECPVDFFYLDSNRQIRGLLGEMVEQNIPVDNTTVLCELQKRGLLQSVGGALYINDLTTGLTRGLSLDHKIRELAACDAKRRFINACNLGIARAMDPGDEFSVTTSEHEAELCAITAADHGKKIRCVDLTADAALEELFNPPPGDGALSTGVEILDGATRGGILPGHYWIYGGMPGRGKTSLARQTMLANALNGVPSLAFSLEMTESMWIQQTAATLARVPASRIQRPEFLNASEKRALQEAAAEFRKKMYIDDSSPLDIGELVSRARMAIRRYGVRLIVCDYLQIIDAPPKETKDRVAYVSNALRELAKSEKVCVIALSQLARPRQINDIPTINSLKESGDIEAHAMTVVLLHMPEADDGEPTGDDLLVVGKQRFGKKGPLPVSYDSNLLTFGYRKGETGDRKTVPIR